MIYHRKNIDIINSANLNLIMIFLSAWLYGFPGKRFQKISRTIYCSIGIRNDTLSNTRYIRFVILCVKLSHDKSTDINKITFPVVDE
jgi:hypothetical protein